MGKQDFATRLQQLQADTYPGQSVRDAALKSQVSYRTLGALLNGTGGKPTFATLTKLASYYNVSIDQLVNGAAEPVTTSASIINELRGLLYELEFKLQELERQTAIPPQKSPLQ